MAEFYTKLFVQIDIALQELLQLVANTCSGNIDVVTIEVDKIEIDIMKNESAPTISDPNDFMSYPYTAEVVNIEDMSLESYLEFTGSLMKNLNSNGAKVVAACDWEDKLPGHGKLE